MSLQTIDQLLSSPVSGIVPDLVLQLEQARMEDFDRKSFYCLVSDLVTIGTSSSSPTITIPLSRDHNFLVTSMGCGYDNEFVFNMRIAGELEYLFSTLVSADILFMIGSPLAFDPPLLIKGGSGIEFFATNLSGALTVNLQLGFFGYLVPKEDSK